MNHRACPNAPGEARRAAQPVDAVLPGAGLPGAALAGAVLAGAVLLGASLLGAAPVGTAWAQDAEGAARAEARAVGATGQAVARGLATDSGTALDVPGFEGTGVPQTGHTASNLESSARAALANPNDDGGAVGSFVASSAAARPDADIDASDPEIQRGEVVEAAPTASAWRADGLASGSVRECGRGLTGAQAPGRCGGVNWCVGTDCERVDTPANTGFVRAATQLNMVMEMGGDEFDRNSLRIFTGEREFCTIRFLGGQNCCTDSGVLIEGGLAGCNAHELELAEARAAGVTHYLGEFCAKRILGICRRRDREWCVFTSELGRILHEQARPQLGIAWANCDGFTVADIQRIDFDRVDLSEFTDTLLDESEAPGVSLPNAGATGTAMRDRIRRYYRDND